MRELGRRSYVGFASAAAIFALMLAGCGSQGASTGAGSVAGNAVPPVSPLTDALVPFALTPMSPIHTSPGAIIGTDNMFNPHDGDTPTGGHGATIDRKVPCLPSMGNGYHVHVFLGIVYNGTLMALPDTLGMVDPGRETNGYTNTAQCFYEIHTHDASGIVHLEMVKSLPYSTVGVFKLRNVLDVWGMPRANGQFGQFRGKMHVFVGTVALGQTVVSSYTRYNGPIDYIPLQSHQVIWIEIGKPYYKAKQLPPVTFYMEY